MVFQIQLISSAEKHTGPSPVKTRAMAATKVDKKKQKQEQVNLINVCLLISFIIKSNQLYFATHTNIYNNIKTYFFYICVQGCRVLLGQNMTVFQQHLKWLQITI